VAEWLRRYVQVVVNFVGAGSSPVECIPFVPCFIDNDNLDNTILIVVLIIIDGIIFSYSKG
jgi:hypothetical protein